MRADVYSRPSKPRTIAVRSREPLVDTLEAPPCPALPLALDRATQCHVTPSDVARRMVSYLAPIDALETLEPSAGTGSLVEALLADVETGPRVTAVERYVPLAHALAERFEEHSDVRVVNRCFLAYAETCEERFARIVMNPPFRHARAHIDAARRLLRTRDAVLVALLPNTREPDGFETLEMLGPDTFALAAVHTRIVRLVR